MKRNGRFAVLAAVLLSSLVIAGCVKLSDDAGGGGGLTTDPLTGELLVTVRIPVSVSTARALTVEQAQRGIDFYEVVFKHSDGRIFIASETIDKTLSIQLPGGEYKTVLLAGTFGGTLLASAYQGSVTVDAATTKIAYELKALNVAVNGPVNKAEFQDPELPSPSGTSKDGFPYFILPTGKTCSGVIVIGNFPDEAIFDPNLLADPVIDPLFNDNFPFKDAIEAVADFGTLDLLRLFTAYTAALAKAESTVSGAEGFAVLAESGAAIGTLITASSYVANARGAAAAYEEMAELLGQIADADPEANFTAVQSAVNSAAALSYANPAAVTAWTTAKAAFASTEAGPTPPKDPFKDGFSVKADWNARKTQVAAAAAAYADAAVAVAALIEAGGSYSAPGAVATATAKKTAITQAVTYPEVAVLKAAFAAANNAITVTSGLTMGSLGVASTGNQPPVVLPFAGGSVVASPGMGGIIFSVGTPRISGLSKLYFDFAFKPFGSSAANTWHIKEGLDNYLVDNGKAEGGSILLSIGSAPSGIIIIGNGPTQ
jgi:hypothetical protein